jgi:6-phosphogluconolactonase
MSTNIFNSQNEQLTALIDNLTHQIKNLLLKQPQVVIAVSGGKSPIELFKRLSQVSLPWQQIIITLVDERVTDTNSIDSNEYLVKKYLLQNRAIPAKFIGLVDMRLSVSEMVAAATDVPHIDIAILGMGEDGHTASLFLDCEKFVQATSLTNSARYISTNSLSAKYARISLTLSGLIAIKSLYLVINGESKFKVYNQALKGENMDYPISLVLHSRSDVVTYWFGE